MEWAKYETAFVSGVATFLAEIANMLQTAKIRSKVHTWAIFPHLDEGYDHFPLLWHQYPAFVRVSSTPP